MEANAKGPAIHKYRTLLEKENTPFSATSATGPIRRLWNYLVRQEDVQDVFIRAIFGKKKSVQDCDNMSSRNVRLETNFGINEPDSLSKFCCKFKK